MISVALFFAAASMSPEVKFQIQGVDDSTAAVELAARKSCEGQIDCLGSFQNARNKLVWGYELHPDMRQKIRKAVLAETAEGTTNWVWAYKRVYELEPQQVRAREGVLRTRCDTRVSKSGKRATTICSTR